MDWDMEILENGYKIPSTSNKEEKINLAIEVAKYVKNGQVIGFGSGSTAYLAVEEIAKKIKRDGIYIHAIPTSYEIKMLCAKLGIPTTTLLEKKPDWCFDGADEVDENGWLIKGRGGALYQEKLNMLNALTYILIDSSKKVKTLGEKFPIPVECVPFAKSYVEQELKQLGANKIQLRMAKGKDGPILTEQGNFILDVCFSDIKRQLEKDIKLITGVIESGLFIDYKIKILNL